MPAIRYEFSSVGADAVKRDFAGIAAEAKTFERTIRSKARPANDAGRAADMAEKAKTRAVERGERERTRIIEREARNRARLEQRELAQLERSTRQKIQADERETRRRALTAERAKKKRLAQVVRSETATGAAIGVFAGSIAERGLSAAADIGISAGRFQLQNKQKAISLSKSGRQAGQQAVDPEELLREAKRTARGVIGTKVGDVLDAQSRYVSMTGDLGEARRYSRTFATAARATGARDEDIASTAATLRDKFGIKSESGMRDALAKLVFQGKSGAFELGDASRYFTEMGAAGSRFGLDKGAKGVATLGGLAQIARTSTGSGAEASTAVQAMLRQLVKNAGKIRQTTGAKVFTDSTGTQTRDVQDVLVDVIRGAKGNQTKLQKIFGDEGMAGVSEMVRVFNEAQKAAGKGATEQERLAAGTKALRAMFDQTISAGGNWAEVQKDAAAQAKSALDQWDSALEKAHGTIGESLEPSIKTLTANLNALDPVVALVAAKFGEVSADLSDFAVNVAKFLGLDVNKKPADRTVESAINDQKRFSDELGTINAREKKHGKLTNRDRVRKAQLEDDLLEVSQFLADNQKPSPKTPEEKLGLNDPLSRTFFGRTAPTPGQVELYRSLNDMTSAPSLSDPLADQVKQDSSWWGDNSTGRTLSGIWSSIKGGADKTTQSGSVVPGPTSWAGGPNALTLIRGINSYYENKDGPQQAKGADFSQAISGLTEAANRLSSSAETLKNSAPPRVIPGSPE